MATDIRLGRGVEHGVESISDGDTCGQHGLRICRVEGAHLMVLRGQDLHLDAGRTRIGDHRTGHRVQPVSQQA